MHGIVFTRFVDVTRLSLSTCHCYNMHICLYVGRESTHRRVVMIRPRKYKMGHNGYCPQGVARVIIHNHMSLCRTEKYTSESCNN